MRGKKLIAVWMTGLIAFFLVSQLHAATPATIMAIQFKPSYDKTKIIFTLDKKAETDVAYYSDPNRVVLIFKNSIKRFNITNASLGGSNVEKVNAEISPIGDVLFTFYTAKPVKYRTEYQDTVSSERVTFVLEIITPDSADSNQLKQDVHDDLLSLLQEKHYRIGKARLDHEKSIKSIRRSTKMIVLIDAGHGGKDPGAIGKNGVYEKEIALNIAKKLAKEINQSENMQAILTRDGDYYVPLRQRLRLARKGDADVFVAIHADAYYKSDTMGMSVFALSQRGATSEAARWLAERDNYSELDGIDFKKLPDQSKMVRSVLIDLSQTATIQSSLKLGNLMLDALDDISSLHYSQVEQAPFVVLKSPDIPSVLVETGFISNPIEARRLSNSDYQDEIAHALYVGLKRYANKHHLKST